MAKAKCRDCDGEMMWADKEEGGGVPLEPGHNPKGNYVLVRLEPGSKPLVRYVKHGEVLSAQAVRYVAHPKVCPKRDQAPPSRQPKPRPAVGHHVNKMIAEALHGGADDYASPRRGGGSRRTGGRQNGLKGSQRKRKDR